MVVVGALLLMGQHELNTAAAIVYCKHYSKHESGENWGGENLIWKMYIMDCCCRVGAEPCIRVSFTRMNIYPRIHISHMYTCGSNGNRVRECVCVCVRHKIWTQLSSPNYDSDVSLEF